MRTTTALSILLLAAGCSSSQSNPGHPGAGGSAGGPLTGGSGADAGAAGSIAGAAGGTAGTGAAGTGVAGAAGTGVAGAAGTGMAGAGGTAGVGGVTGTGNVGGNPPCVTAGQAGAAGGAGGASTAPADIESCAYDASSQPVLSSVSASVTVTSVDQVAEGNCNFISFPLRTPSSAPSTKVTLQTADQQSWSVYLRIPGLPADVLAVGAKFDLAITAQSVFWQGDGQLITLSQAGKLVAFGYSGFTLPSLSDFGIALTNIDATCMPYSCAFAHLGVHVVHGTDAADVLERQTARIGDLSFTLTTNIQWVAGGACDQSNHVFLGGFIAPP